ncbi:MAG: GNAT family N-acetyltransferase [Nocardioidaceae bacterium]
MDAVITVVPATSARWEDVSGVMGVRGDPAHCWCQFFKLRGRDWQSATRESNRAALREQVCDEDLPPGVLAYVEDRPVGWCAVAPKSSYPRLLASRVSAPIRAAEDDGVWSVSCFVVVVGWRRKGVAGALLRGAVGLARAHGATAVDGYPVDPDARRSVTAAELYHGTTALFLAAGFREVRRPTPGRVAVRMELRSGR